MERINKKGVPTETEGGKEIEQAEIGTSMLLESLLDKEVRSIDPLNADTFFAETLPLLNEVGDVESITAAVRYFLPSLEQIENFGIVEGRAALRDLGHIAASLRRHEVDIETLPDLKDGLLRLSNLTDEVPRDTVFSYGPRNPEGDRQRTFTSLQAERIFINSFTVGMENLINGASALLNAKKLGPSDPEWISLCSNASQSFDRMIDAIRDVRENISPEIFTNSLRPYFEPILIDGNLYHGPGGAQMPVLLYDQLIWGSDSENETYRSYASVNVAYSPPSVRNLMNALDGKSSMVTQVKSVYGVKSSPLEGSAQALIKVLNTMLRFRAPHRMVAANNFVIRPEFALGSGGYSESILDLLLTETNSARSQLISVVND